MTVYIEYVLIDNFLIDYLLLKATFSTTGISVRKGRLFLCAIFGAVTAIVYPFFENFYILQTVFKIFSGLLIVLIAVKFSSVKSYVINALIFFLYTFLMGGAIIGIYNLLNIPYQTEISVAFMVIPVYLLITGMERVIKYLYRRREIMKLTVKVELEFSNKKVALNGFYDTGNGVYDGDSPVIFCTKKTFTEIVGDNLLRAKLKKICIFTVNGETENFAVSLDKIKIYNKDEPNIYNNVTLCATKNSVGDGYDVILHPALMESDYENQNYRKVKKVS